jgi:hypothetical protein
MAPKRILRWLNRFQGRLLQETGLVLVTSPGLDTMDSSFSNF